jgi:hypothetical protein
MGALEIAIAVIVRGNFPPDKLCLRAVYYFFNGRSENVANSPLV